MLRPGKLEGVFAAKMYVNARERSASPIEAPPLLSLKPHFNFFVLLGRRQMAEIVDLQRNCHLLMNEL